MEEDWAAVEGAGWVPSCQVWYLGKLEGEEASTRAADGVGSTSCHPCKGTASWWGDKQPRTQLPYAPMLISVSPSGFLPFPSLGPMFLPGKVNSLHPAKKCAGSSPGSGHPNCTSRTLGR